MQVASSSHQAKNNIENNINDDTNQSSDNVNNNTIAKKKTKQTGAVKQPRKNIKHKGKPKQAKKKIKEKEQQIKHTHENIDTTAQSEKSLQTETEKIASSPKQHYNQPEQSKTIHRKVRKKKTDAKTSPRKIRYKRENEKQEPKKTVHQENNKSEKQVSETPFSDIPDDDKNYEDEKFKELKTDDNYLEKSQDIIEKENIRNNRISEVITDLSIPYEEEFILESDDTSHLPARQRFELAVENLMKSLDFMDIDIDYYIPKRSHKPRNEQNRKSINAKSNRRQGPNLHPDYQTGQTFPNKK